MNIHKNIQDNKTKAHSSIIITLWTDIKLDMLGYAFLYI